MKKKKTGVFYAMLKVNQEFLLPITPDDFAQLVSVICKECKVPEGEYAAHAVMSAIHHLPQEKARTTKGYLIDMLHKRIANTISWNCVAQIKADREKAEQEAKTLEESTEDMTPVEAAV